MKAQGRDTTIFKGGVEEEEYGKRTRLFKPTWDLAFHKEESSVCRPLRTLHTATPAAIDKRATPHVKEHIAELRQENPAGRWEVDALGQGTGTPGVPTAWKPRYAQSVQD